MIIFGWLCLLGIALYLSTATLVMARLSLGFAGKLGWEPIIFLLLFLLLAVGAWWIVYANFPFEVAVKP